MSHPRVGAGAFALALLGAVVMAEAQGKPATAPPAPPSTPVAAPAVPPENPPDSLIDYVCALLPVPYLCD